MRVPTLALFLLLCFSSTSFADQKSHRASVEQLMAVMKMETSVKSSIDKMLEMQLQANPQMAPYKSVLQKFFDKYLSWAALKEHFIQLYVDAFTESEIREMTAFYTTPTGRKAASLLPALSAKGAEIGASAMKAHMGELLQQLKAAAEKQQAQ